MRAAIYLVTIISCIFFLAVLAACQPRSSDCPSNSIGYLTDHGEGKDLDQDGPVVVEIRGRETRVDRVVHGAFCDDHWAGKVYGACDLQIPDWEGEPTFLEACSLTIEPGTVVYVAAHNDEAFYKGCSCHTLGDPDF